MFAKIIHILLARFAVALFTTLDGTISAYFKGCGPRLWKSKNVKQDVASYKQADNLRNVGGFSVGDDGVCVVIHAVHPFIPHLSR